MGRMKLTLRSPWYAVSIALLGLVAGYSLVIAQHGATAFAGSAQCPLQMKGACTGDNCDQNPVCAGADCPMHKQNLPS